MTDSDLASITSDIFRGYSIYSWKKKDIYLKHSSWDSQAIVMSLLEKYKCRAISKGIPTEKERLEYLIEQELWSNSDENKLISLKSEIENLNVTLKNIAIKSTAKTVKDKISLRNSELAKLSYERLDIIGMTAESFASRRASDDLLRSCLFSDPELKLPLYSEEEFSDLSGGEIAALNEIKNEIDSKFEESNLKKIALSSFFSNYLSYCENPYQFFGSPVAKLTFNQVRMLSIGDMFYNIFQNVPDIPDNIKNDPDLLLSFVQRDSSKEKGKMFKEDADATVVFGTKEDVDEISGGNTVSFSEVLKEKGGKMNMKELMRLSNHDV